MDTITKKKITNLVLSGNMLASQLRQAALELGKHGFNVELDHDLVNVWNERADELGRWLNTQPARQRPAMEPPVDYVRSYNTGKILGTIDHPEANHV